MELAAVLGSPIEHSLSPVLHNAGYAALGMHWHYVKKECTAEQLPAVLDRDFRGYSVTMPCKFAALEVADTATDRAREIGSANTLVRTRHGWHADNTDVDGVLGAIAELGVSPKTAVLIGGGGTARAVLWALRSLGCDDITLMNRSDRGAELGVPWVPLGEVPASDIVISTLPGSAAAALDVSAPLFDVSYSPWPPPLIKKAREKKLPAVAGHVMLAYQAYAQFELFTGEPAPQERMRAALEGHLGLS
ncbi:shikimate dehydrogenase [Corynebacterium sp. H128]|uniref:shikimate dehydrogenase n=1 Tax=unclassified Corynebacterium TaxID=2624378 RepID=UPI0030A61596